MKLSTSLAVAMLVVTLIYVGCASKQCNNVPQNPYTMNATPTPVPSGVTDDFKTADIPKVSPVPKATAPLAEPKEPTVSVSKSTGEVQCEGGRGLSLDKMQESLTNAKVKVYSAHTQSDGLLHMAVCGAPAGNVHVFKIPAKDVKKAERLGFKVFKPRKD